jgi:hypothetical protein
LKKHGLDAETLCEQRGLIHATVVLHGEKDRGRIDPVSIGAAVPLLRRRFSNFGHAANYPSPIMVIG